MGTSRTSTRVPSVVDVAVASWSLTWNLGPGFGEPFLEEYGIALDHERLAFYRLLYDLVS